MLATGEAHSVREFVELSFAEVSRNLEWQGKGLEEEGVDKDSGKVLVRVDPKYYRPTEVEYLLGDPTKANKLLDWRHTTSFPELVREMVAADLALMARERRINSE